MISCVEKKLLFPFSEFLHQVEPLAEDLLPLCLYARAKYNFEEEVASGDGGVKDMFFFENG